MHDIVANVETSLPFMAIERRNGLFKTGARISIRRLSTNKWWNGGSSTWVDDIVYNSMTHIAKGSHEYLMTFPASGEYQLLYTDADELMINDSYTITVYPEERLEASVLRGEGATVGTITILEDSVPVADADVWVTSDEAGLNIVAGTLQSNSVGEVEFWLDEGVTYYIWGQKDGHNFDNPQEVVW